MNRRLILLIAILSVFVVLAFAQTKFPSATNIPISLTTDEEREIKEVISITQQAEQIESQKRNEALNADLNKAAEFLGNWQSSFFKAEVARRERERILNKHRNSHNCQDCFYTEDYKSLVKKQQAKQE